MALPNNIEVAIEYGDIVDFKADVVVLKHAQQLYGADAAVAKRLSMVSPDIASALPDVGQFELFATRQAVASPLVVFIGTVPLQYFRYQEIREFGRTTMSCLRSAVPDVEHVALTIHGNYGLDELQFDVRGHRCLLYNSIRELEKSLSKELIALSNS